VTLSSHKVAKNSVQESESSSSRLALENCPGSRPDLRVSDQSLQAGYINMNIIMVLQSGEFYVVVVVVIVSTSV